MDQLFRDFPNMYVALMRGDVKVTVVIKELVK